MNHSSIQSPRTVEFWAPSTDRAEGDVEGEHEYNDNVKDNDHKYGDDFSDRKRHSHRLQRARMCRCLIYSLAAWGFVSLCYQVYNLWRPISTRTILASSLSRGVDVYRPSTFSDPALNLCDCGNDTTVALSNGCIYDSLAAAWLPPHCRDDALTHEFDHSGPGPDGAWPYFADANGTIPITKSGIAELGTGAFWGSRDWHLAHCMFYWEKTVRMRETGAVMERRFDRVAHVRHCRRLAMKRDPDHGLLIEVDVVMNSKIEQPKPDAGLMLD